MQNDFVLGNLDNLQTSSFDPFPAGDYELRAVGIEVKPTKAGQAFKVEFDVIGGEHEGRKIFEWFNFDHPNSQVVEIALTDIKSWIGATGGDDRGNLTAQRVYDLEGLPFRAKIKVEKDKTGEHADQNRIARYYAANQSAPAQAAPVVAPAGQVPAAAYQQQAAPAQAPTKAWEQ